MDLGMIGLGRMGANLVRRLLRDGHRAVVHDIDSASVAALVSEGAEGAASLADLAGKLSGPRAVWVMVPAGITGQVIDDVASHLGAGDIIIDGGNSFYQDDLARSAALAERGIRLLDVGNSFHNFAVSVEIGRRITRGVLQVNHKAARLSAACATTRSCRFPVSPNVSLFASNERDCCMIGRSRFVSTIGASVAVATVRAVRDR